MTKKLKELLERAEGWPQEVQDELVQSGLELEAGHSGSYALTKEDKVALERSAQDVRTGSFAPDKDVSEFFDRNRA